MAPAEAPLADRWAIFFAATGCVVAMGTALEISNGNQHPISFILLICSLGLSLFGLAAPRWAWLEHHLPRLTFLAAGGGLAWQVAQLLSRSPGMYVEASETDYRLFLSLLGAAAVIAASALGELSGWIARARMPVLFAMFLALGGWMLAHSTDPYIDVFTWHVESIEHFLGGENPYALTMPDIYGSPDFYGPGLLVDGRVMVGFPYPPFSLFLSTLGYLVGGDYRWANVVAIAGAGALIAASGRTRLAALAPALLLFSPRVYFVLEQGWTEAYVVFFVALVVWAAIRRPSALPLVLGLFFAIKHYLLLSAPLVLLLLPRPLRLRDVVTLAWKSALVAGVLTIPMALWDPAAFFHDLVTFQSLQPFRMDALTVLSWWANGDPEHAPSTVFGFVAFALITALALWRAPRTPSGWAFSLGAAYLFFFAFSKQAFSNYYFFIIGAFCVALGAVPRTLQQDPA